MALSKEQEECLAGVGTAFGSRYGQPMYGDPFAGKPKDLVTEELRLAVVQKNGIMLQFVPEKLKTQAVCLAAVVELVYALQYVPVKQMTEAVLIAALNHDSEPGARGATGVHQVIPYIPEKAMTEGFCFDALQKGCLSLDKIPKKLMTEAFCIAAAKKDINVLHTNQYFPKEVRDKAEAALNAAGSKAKTRKG